MTRPTKRPYGLKELAKIHTVRDMMALTGASGNAVRKWAYVGGFKYKNMRENPPATMPDNIVDLAEKHTAPEIARMFEVHVTTANRWAERAGTSCVRSPKSPSTTKKPTRAEFIAIARDFSILEVAKHYKHSPSAISQWAKEFKFKPRKYCVRCGMTQPGNDFGPNSKTCGKHFIEKNPSFDRLKTLHFAHQVEGPVCLLKPI